MGSIKAKLAGVRPFVGEDWDKKATDWFRARILDRNLLALVQAVEEDRTLSLILVDTSGEEEEGVDIAREMFELGLARKVI